MEPTPGPKWQIGGTDCQSAHRMNLPRVLLWVLRAAWATLPLTAGAALGAGLDGRSSAVQLTASMGLWAVWAVVLVATLGPHPITLTVVRVGAPGAVLAVVAGRPVDQAGTLALALAGALVAAGVAFLPETAMPFVNGPAYPNERRFPLRVPAPLLLGPIALAWLVVVVVPAVGVLAIAAGAWVLGGVLVGLGVPAGWVLARSLHALSRRWVVFVPAGLVLHDPLALADPVLFQKKVVESLHLAPAGTDSLDLTKGAFGMALELVLKEKVPMVLIVPGDRGGEAGSSARLLFTPTRLGAVLEEARRRGLRVS